MRISTPGSSRRPSSDRSAATATAPHSFSITLYGELRSLARSYLSRERRDHTLRPTDLVHEACVNLLKLDRIDWQGRTHVKALAAETMRRVLVDHARKAAAAKRGGGRVRLSLDERMVAEPARDVVVLDVDDALVKLERLNARHARIVELRFFGGLSIDEVAEGIGVSPRTVREDWRFARTWLIDELNGWREDSE